MTDTVVYHTLCLQQTAFSDFLMGSSKDLAKHIRVVVRRAGGHTVEPSRREAIRVHMFSNTPLFLCPV